MHRSYTAQCLEKFTTFINLPRLLMNSHPNSRPKIAYTLALMTPSNGPGIASDTGRFLLTDQYGEAVTMLRANNQIGTFNSALRVDGVASAKTVTLTITAVPTSVALTMLPETPTQDDTITLMATVQNDYGEPTGDVAFTLGNNAIGSAVLEAGVATVTLPASNLSAGVHTAVAKFSGQGMFEGSKSPDQQLNINYAKDRLRAVAIPGCSCSGGNDGSGGASANSAALPASLLRLARARRRGRSSLA